MNIEIIRGNKIIAEFMGDINLTKVKDDRIVPYDINYNILWDNLIPVVERIEGFNIDLNISVVIKNNKCEIYRHKNSPYEYCIIVLESESKIKATWLAVIEFIKWYNQNNNQ